MRQNEKSIDDFYQEITALNASISQKIYLDANYRSHEGAVMHFVSTLTMNSFIDGLNEPYSSYTRNYRPTTIREAYQAAQEQYLANLRKREKNNLTKKNQFS